MKQGVDGFSSVAVNVPISVDRFTKIATVELTANYANTDVCAKALIAGFTAENNKFYYIKLQGGRDACIENQLYEVFYIGNLAVVGQITGAGGNTIGSRYKSTTAENKRFTQISTGYNAANNIGDKYDVYEVDLP